LQRAQEETEVAAAEEEIQRHYLEMLSHKHNLEQKLGTAYSAVPPPSVEHQALQQQQEQLANDLRKVGYSSYTIETKHLFIFCLLTFMVQGLL
jgi:lysyl-tRNA synthetase class I